MKWYLFNAYEEHPKRKRLQPFPWIFHKERFEWDATPNGNLFSEYLRRCLWCANPKARIGQSQKYTICVNEALTNPKHKNVMYRGKTQTGFLTLIH